MLFSHDTEISQAGAAALGKALTRTRQVPHITFAGCELIPRLGMKLTSGCSRHVPSGIQSG